jgi:hypothetical protein
MERTNMPIITNIMDDAWERLSLSPRITKERAIATTAEVEPTGAMILAFPTAKALKKNNIAEKAQIAVAKINPIVLGDDGIGGVQTAAKRKIGPKATSCT